MSTARKAGRYVRHALGNSDSNRMLSLVLLEKAERLLDFDLLTRYGMGRDDPGNPYKRLYDRILHAYERINREEKEAA